MKMKKLKLILFAFFSVFVVLSCSKDDTIIISETSKGLDDQFFGEKMVLGNKLINPYSVDNMQKAYNALLSETKAGSICATHRYVKFIPKNENELSLLKLDSTLVLFQYPLDYEIISYGSYRDPNIPENQPTPLYCSVPVEKELPIGVEYIILEDLFIPEEQNMNTKSSFLFSEDFVDALVTKAFELTGNEEDIEPQTKAKKSKWIPQGSVKYYDPIKGKELPIEGLQIRCNRWFTTYTAYTNVDGTFKCKDSESFKNPANYSIVFERYDFEIRDAWLSTAKYDGPKTEGAWNVNFQGDMLSTYYSTIFRAAYKYYYGDIHGLSRPPKNGTWKTQLKIKATKKEKDYLGYHNSSLRFIGLGSAIHLYTFEEQLDVTYSTTIHELAHATHWGLYKSDYNNASEFVLESWTRGVQVFLTKDEYPNYDIFSYSSVSYTGIIKDMMDDVGLTKTCWYYYDTKKDDFVEYNSPKSYVDNITGYTLPQIEKSLNGARDAISWKNNLKNLYNNETENNLDDAFTFWSTI